MKTDFYFVSAGRITFRGHSLLLFCLCFIPVFICTALAQDSREAEQLKMAKEVAAEAEKLAKEGELERAEAYVVEKLRARLEKEPLAHLNFTRGWLLEQMAAEKPECKDILLSKASEAYGIVLRHYPDNEPATEGLVRVLRQRGQTGQAIRLLARPSRDLPLEQRYTRLLALSDIYIAEDDYAKALNTLEDAYKLNPADGRAPWKIISICPSSGAGWKQKLFDYGDKFSRAWPQIASRCYGRILREESSPTDKVANAAAEAWVDLEGSRATFVSSSFARLPEGTVTKLQPLSELKPWLVTPLQAKTASFKFWQSSDLRRHIAAAALKSLAQEHRLAGRPQEAAHLADAAREIAPPFGAYSRNDLKDRPLIGLDVALDLSTLYHAYPTLDPDGQKFRLLENELLDQKNMSYAEQNLPAMEKFHTVLGLVYAERGKWNTGDWRAAPYHLERAVSTAQRLANRQPTEYKPHPELTMVLATGLATNAQTKDLQKARNLYLESAQGYLDKGDTERATRMLNQVQAISRDLNQPEPATYNDLYKILDTKKRVRTIKQSDLVQPDAGTKVDPVATLETSSLTALDPAYVNRQKIQAYQELEKKALDAGALDKAKIFHSNALDKVQKAPGATEVESRKIQESPVIRRPEIQIRKPPPPPTTPPVQRTNPKLLNETQRKAVVAPKR